MKRNEQWAVDRAREFCRADGRADLATVLAVHKHLWCYIVDFPTVERDVMPRNVLVGVSRLTGRVWYEPIR